MLGRSIEFAFASYFALYLVAVLSSLHTLDLSLVSLVHWDPGRKLWNDTEQIVVKIVKISTRFMELKTILAIE